MTDLDAAIREKLASFNDEGCVDYGWMDTGYKEMRGAILAVLDEHPLDETHMCAKPDNVIPESWYDNEPCPTLLAIAKGLGIEL